MTARLIALDWGTSALRAFLLGDGGAVLDTRAAPLGIMQVPAGGFPAAFASVAGPWRQDAPALPAIACGMVGSAQGWRMAPYVDGAVDLAALGAGLTQVDTADGGTLSIVPGLSTRDPTPDVMRGEETQIFGALALRPGMGLRVRLVLPGTHSKWASLDGGRLTGFRTFMTGELFAVLRAHSILGRLADAPGGGPAFEEGVRAAQASPDGIAPLLFSARARALLGAMPGADSLDYLSGLLIGDELRCALAGPDAPVALVGSPALCAQYRRAFACFGRPDVADIPGAAEAGLWRIAVAAGLVARSAGSLG